MLHLNINSILNNLFEVDEPLHSNQFDLFLVRETKLDDTISNSFYINNNYLKIRVDRNRHGGGLLIFIKSSLIVTSTKFLKDIELIYFQLNIDQQHYNFVYSYKSPVINDLITGKLKEFMYSLDLNDPLFIIGDLNMDMLDKNNKNLVEFLGNNDLVYFVTEPTRVSQSYCNCNKSQKLKSSKTIIDVILHNGDFIENTQVINCPFSDHCFVAANLLLKTMIKTENSTKNITCRNLSAKNLYEITNLIENVNFKPINQLDTFEDKWSFLKNTICKIVDQIAPLKKIQIK